MANKDNVMMKKIVVMSAVLLTCLNASLYAAVAQDSQAISQDITFGTTNDGHYFVVSKRPGNAFGIPTTEHTIVEYNPVTGGYTSTSEHHVPNIPVLEIPIADQEEVNRLIPLLEEHMNQNSTDMYIE